jgi:hypothetical protein
MRGGARVGHSYDGFSHNNLPGFRVLGHEER